MSFIEECLAAELKKENIAFDREVEFDPSGDRKFRADFHITGTPLLIFTQGQECELKAFRRGFFPMRLRSCEEVQSGEALEAIKSALFSLVEMGT